MQRDILKRSKRKRRKTATGRQPLDIVHGLAREKIVARLFMFRLPGAQQRQARRDPQPRRAAIAVIASI